jgi:hypothetical protein
MKGRRTALILASVLILGWLGDTHSAEPDRRRTQSEIDPRA